MRTRLTAILMTLILVLLAGFPSVLADGSWTCPECGQTGNTGNYCSNCAAARPSEEWTCPNCGQAGNTGNFCTNCAFAGRPADRPSSRLKRLLR